MHGHISIKGKITKLHEPTVRKETTVQSMGREISLNAQCTTMHS